MPEPHHYPAPTTQFPPFSIPSHHSCNTYNLIQPPAWDRGGRGSGASLPSPKGSPGLGEAVGMQTQTPSIVGTATPPWEPWWEEGDTSCRRLLNV